MGYVSGEDGFTLIFKYDTEKNRIYLYSLTKLLEAEENKKTGKFLQSPEARTKMVKCAVENVIANVARNFLNTWKSCELKHHEKHKIFIFTKMFVF